MKRWLWRAAWLLVPMAWALHRFARAGGERRGAIDALTFLVACAALVPLAKTMGDATEALADHLGPAPGSLLNATFGNAAELILGIVGLRHAHLALVKGSLTGSILGNLLLVVGAATVAGGARFSRLRFNRLAATSSVSTMYLAVVALLVPTLLATGNTRFDARLLSLLIACVLVAMYGLSLWFGLGTHSQEMSERRQPVFATPAEAAAAQAPRPRPRAYDVKGALARLALAGATTAVASELLVGALDGAVQTLHLPETFVGVIIVAIVGNAAEHSTAVIFARRGDMDVAMGIAWESSKQIALFVAPVLVFAGAALGAPMDLVFTRFEVIALFLGILALALIALDGETHWLEGAFLLAVYVVLGLGFYFHG